MKFVGHSTGSLTIGTHGRRDFNFQRNVARRIHVDFEDVLRAGDHVSRQRADTYLRRIVDFGEERTTLHG